MNYKITKSTSTYIARRNKNEFPEGKTIVTIAEGSLEETRIKLLEVFNDLFEENMSDWKSAKRRYPFKISEKSDHTIQFEYDSRYYKIVKSEE